MSDLYNRDIVTRSERQAALLFRRAVGELVNERMASTSARKSASVCPEAASNAPRRSKRTFGP